jgi:hypothetical protein
MQTIANYEICFDCRKTHSKQELYKDWESYSDGLFHADEENERMYELSQLIQRSSLWRCVSCRPFTSSNLIGKKLERIDEYEEFTDISQREKEQQQELDEMYT